MGSAASFVISHAIKSHCQGDVKRLSTKVEHSPNIPPCVNSPRNLRSTRQIQPSCPKDDGIRSAVTTDSNDRKSIRSNSKRDSKKSVDKFDDSSYHKSWLSESESEAFFLHLKAVGEEKRPRTGAPVSMKYPLWALYYGMKRQKDNAIAVDRWGSPYESLLRVEDPSAETIACCEKLKKTFGLQFSSVNSIVVNYYFDGDSTFIPGMYIIHIHIYTHI
jgi:hypothetical protein